MDSDAYKFIFQDDNNILTYLENIEAKKIIRRPKIHKERINYFEQYDDVDFCRRFRLSKDSVYEVLNKIEDKLEFPSDRNHSISPINQLLLTLRYYATGAQQITVGDFSGVSKSTANRVIHRVSTAIASLSHHFIKFPETPEEIQRTQLDFHSIARFPKVIGALDCTHVRIRSPGGNHAEYYRNRKGYMSINVQAICNAHLQLTDLVVRWPGSTHDVTIFNASYRNTLFENNCYGDTVLVADSGYKNVPYIMMPLDNPQTTEEKLYNESQIRTRNPVERFFGVWKRRFPVLAVGMQMELQNCIPVIVATGVLQNIVQNAKEELPPDDPELRLPAPWEQILEEGRIRSQAGQPTADINPTRQALINNYFKSLHLQNSQIQ